MEKIDRVFFIKHVKGGRRYERLFTTFKEMIALAEKPAGAKDQRASTAEPGGNHSPAASVKQTEAHPQLGEELTWPFPTGSRP